MGKRLVIPDADFSVNAIEREPIPIPVLYTLTNGYAAAAFTNYIEVDNDPSANLIRVRTDQISGSYTVKTKPGYVIRSIAAYDNFIEDLSPGEKYVSGVVKPDIPTGTTEFTFSNEGKYSIITFCKTDATAEISASEDIVDYIIRPLE